jgi:hypothetical protein
LSDVKEVDLSALSLMSVRESGSEIEVIAAVQKAELPSAVTPSGIVTLPAHPPPVPLYAIVLVEPSQAKLYFPESQSSVTVVLVLNLPDPIEVTVLGRLIEVIAALLRAFEAIPVTPAGT